VGRRRGARGADLTDRSPRRAPFLRAGLVAVPLLGLLHLAVGAVWPPESHVGAAPDAVAPGTATGWALRILLTLCITAAVVLGPGLYLRQRARDSGWFGPAFVWVPGTLVLGTTGLIAWLLAHRIDPDVTAAIVLVPVLVALTWWTTRVRLPAVFAPGEAAVCGLLLLVVLAGVGKATWSEGPTGELYGGAVSRTLESSDRPDSRIPFHVVQLVTHGTEPDSDVAGAYFGPYYFSDRPALAGLSAAPVVLSSGAEPPISLLDEPWEPFDREGFAAYRITLEFLAATVLLSTFGLLSTFLSRRAAWAGTLVIALTPFVVHEVYFTWPKLFAASFGVAALAALLSRRTVLAAALLGLSYLAHPGALFVAVAVVGIWLGVMWQRRARSSGAAAKVELGAWVASVARDGTVLVSGVVAAVLLWRVANVGNPVDPDRFVSYLFEANTIRPVEFSQWAASRLRSLGNTLVPGELFAWDHDSGPLNPPGSAHPLVIPFSFQYWNTLPFGVGIVYFPVFVVGLWRFARRNAAIAITGLLLPFVIFALYWGSYASGLMREGLQGWVVFALVGAFLGHSAGENASRSRWARVVRIVMPLRGVEVLVMLLASTVWTNGWLGDRRFVLTDVAALALMFGGVGAIMLLTWRAFDPARLNEPGEPAPAQFASLRRM
jgi:hypothetical protein